MCIDGRYLHHRGVPEEVFHALQDVIIQVQACEQLHEDHRMIELLRVRELYFFGDSHMRMTFYGLLHRLGGMHNLSPGAGVEVEVGSGGVPDRPGGREKAEADPARKAPRSELPLRAVLSAALADGSTLFPPQLRAVLF